MSIDSNRQVALEFYRRFDAGDIPGVLALMAEDATFWIAGKPGSSPTAGRLHSKEQIGDLFRRMTAALTGPLRMEVKSTVAEGDRVALEVESRAELANGRIYNQDYHALMTIRDGKIAAVREYLDTEHVQAVWYRR
jgi:hypothetical protein